MTKFVEMSWSCGSIDEARKVARYLVQERLVANAQIVPWIESIYMLNNQLETAQESKVYFKTRHSLIDKVTQVIIENSSYQVPEILFSSIEGGNDDFLHWLEASIQDYSNVSPTSKNTN
ncbi:MAG: divalent-cation tolerance protein CutA [Parachlamydiales bacterium]